MELPPEFKTFGDILDFIESRNPTDYTIGKD